MKAAPLPDCWGIDTSYKLTATDYLHLRHATLPNGRAIDFVVRYVSIGTPNPGDITVDELKYATDAGLSIFLVQHVHYAGWAASGQLGADMGKRAAAHAVWASYPKSAYVFCDLEGVGVGDSAAFVTGWGHEVQSAGFGAGLYVGYSTLLTPEQLYKIPTVDRYWSDFGPRTVATRGFCCKQYEQTRVAGIGVDPNHAFADAKGAAIVAATA